MLNRTFCWVKLTNNKVTSTVYFFFISRAFIFFLFWELSVHRKHCLDHCIYNSLSLQFSTTLLFDTVPTLLLTEKCLQYQKWYLYKGEEWFLHLFVLTRWEVVQPVLTKAMCMCMACLEYTHPPPLSHLSSTSPIPPILLAQNLSS